MPYRLNVAGDFAGQVLQLRRFGLHPERQLERLDAAFERGVGARPFEMVFIHLTDEIQLHPLDIAWRLRRDERDFRITRGRTDGADRRPRNKAPAETPTRNCLRLRGSASGSP